MRETKKRLLGIVISSLLMLVGIIADFSLACFPAICVIPTLYLFINLNTLSDMLDDIDIELREANRKINQRLDLFYFPKDREELMGLVFYLEAKNYTLVGVNDNRESSCILTDGFNKTFEVLHNEDVTDLLISQRYECRNVVLFRALI